MTTEEKIQKTERTLNDLLLLRHLMSDEEFWERVDYYLDYLIPLYKQRRKKY